MSALLLNNTVVFLLNRMHEIFLSLSLKFLKMVQRFLAACWNFFCMHIITLIDQGSVVFIAEMHVLIHVGLNLPKLRNVSFCPCITLQLWMNFMALLSKCVVYTINWAINIIPWKNVLLIYDFKTNKRNKYCSISKLWNRIWTLTSSWLQCIS